MFGSTSLFGTPSTPTFGTPSSTPAFGTPSSTPAFGTPSSTPSFGTPSSTPAFCTPSSTPAFGAPSSTPAFGSTVPAFGTPSATPAFGTPSASAFSNQLFQQPQQQQSPAFSLFPQQQQTSGFGGFQQTPPTNSFFGQNVVQPQITTQMAPMAPISLSLADRDLQAIIDAYKEEPANQKFAYRYLLFSVTDPGARVKPVGASDIMWAEAMGKLEGMESADRERLWPQLVQGFKDLSDRLKLQDEVMASDEERLRMTQNNVKMLQRHFQTDTLPWIQKLKHKEQGLQRRLLRVMRIVEALEGKGMRMPLTKGECELNDRLSAVARQLKGPAAELPKRVHNLLTIARVNANVGVGSTYLPASARIDEQSLAEMQEVLQQETEAIAKLANVLKRDSRDMEIIMSEGTDMTIDDEVGRQSLKRL